MALAMEHYTAYSYSEFSLFISWGYAEILPKCLVLKFKIKKLQ